MVLPYPGNWQFSLEHPILTPMSRSRKSVKRSANTPKAEPAPRQKDAESRGQVQGTRSLFKDLIIGLVICFAFFALVETILRLVDFPAVEPGEDPFVGFSATRPLFDVKDGIASTSRSRLRYFNEVSFPVGKPANTMRIFCFGGSTTYGRPLDGRTSFSRWLQDLLKAADPQISFEVINAGGISYASYRIVPLVREALRYQPDLMILYTGHNEFLERRTYSGLFEQGRGLVTVRSVVENLHVYKALKILLELAVPGLRPGVGTQSGNSPLETRHQTGTSRTSDSSSRKSILRDDVTAILDRSAGLELYHRDEEFSKGVVRHFVHNLNTIIALCRKAGVPLFMVQPASNLKNFSPFKSEHSHGLNGRQKSELDKDIRRAARLVGKGEFDQALALVDRAIREDPLYAETYYWRGKALLGKGRYREAKQDFVQARDLDVCPLRCISTLEQKVTDIARKQGVPLVAFREKLERIASKSGDKSGIPGNESFLDHVHPTIRNHQVLAEQILQKMVSQGMIKATHELTQEERTAVYEKGMNALDPNVFVSKDLNLAKVLKWAGKKDEAREVLLRAARVLTRNPEVHKMLGSFLLDDGKFQEAIEHYEKAVLLSGNDPQMEFGLAVAYYRAGRKREALRLYEKLSKGKEAMPDATANLAMVYLEDGTVEESLSVLERALKKTPDAEVLYAPYGLALAISRHPCKGIAWMQRAVRAEPGNAGHLYNLAGMYALCGQTAEALQTLDQAVDKGYHHAHKMAQDPVFASIRGLPAFSNIMDRIR